MKRRTFLERASLAVAVVLLRPTALFAAWNRKYFQQVSIERAFLDVLGTKDLLKTDRISITVPALASDSSAVPVEINSRINGDRIYLFVEKNITPLVFSCSMYGAALPSFALNIKMKESSLVYGVVREGGKFHIASVQVNVLAQAC